jgi:ribonuclease BN (tRNA processing enzyme)
VIGLPFFAPLYKPETSLTIWSHKSAIEKLLSVEFFPVSLDELKGKIHFQSPETSCKIGPLTFHFHRTHHPSNAYCFRIETPHQKIGYVTDNEIFKNFHGSPDKAPEDPSFIQFLTGCDLLIHEAQYSPEEYHKKVGWGHSSSSNAAALLQKTKIGRWLVVHHDPKHTDADLDRLSSSTQKLLDSHNIACQSEWIGDGHLLTLS